MPFISKAAVGTRLIMPVRVPREERRHRPVLRREEVREVQELRPLTPPQQREQLRLLRRHRAADVHRRVPVTD